MPEPEEETTCGTRIGTPEQIEERESAIQNAALARGEFDDEEVTYVIPLVFHIIHKGEVYGTGSNISNTQIYSAVSALNKDYSKELDSTGDGNGVKTPFVFILANKDDNGYPTGGINRVNGAALSSVYADEGINGSYGGGGESEGTVKNWSKWSYLRVCNIWVVSEIDNNNGGSGIQGYAYLPNTATSSDGIVLLFNTLGFRPEDGQYGESTFNLKSYTNLNKTLTHEMGHYLGLYHTFQGNSCTESNCNLQGDRVCDTPPTIMNSNGQYPACNGTQQVANYMDYTGQVYKNMFTQGQTDRMILATENARSALITSNAFDNLSTMDADLTFEIVNPPFVCCEASVQSLKVKITNVSEEIIHKIEMSYDFGGVTEYYTWYGAVAEQSLGGHYFFSIAVFPTDYTRTVTVNVLSVNDNLKSISASKEIVIPTNDSYRVEVNLDILGGQISWDIEDTDSNILLYVSPAYPNFRANTIISKEICLPNGNYRFTVRDSAAGTNTEGAYIKLFDQSDTEVFVAEDTFSELFYDFSIPSSLDNDTFIGEINHVGHYDFAMGTTQIGELNTFLTNEYEL